MTEAQERASGKKLSGVTGGLNTLNPQRFRELYPLYEVLAQVFGDDDATRRFVALLPMLPPIRKREGQKKRGRPKGSVTFQAASRDMALLALAEVIRDATNTLPGDDLSERAIATIVVEDIDEDEAVAHRTGARGAGEAAGEGAGASGEVHNLAHRREDLT